MVEALQSRIEELRKQIKGAVLLPGDEGYDTARSLWNGAYDRRPAVIVRCASTPDVVNAVNFGRAHFMEIAVRGGGHNFSGNASCDNGVMVHLGDMKSVTIETENMRALVGGGATWADLDAATQEHGLAVPGGFISHTGVAGLTLGGGIGWLTKMAGLSCDNMVGAEVVTADGSVVRASETENPDLFWALRGGGGNFGIVTTFEFKLHKVGPMVNLGLLFWEMERGAEALRLCRAAVWTLDPDSTAFIAIAFSAPPAPFVPPDQHFRLGNALVIVGFGSAEAHAATVAGVREKLAPLFELVTPMPYVALQQMFNYGAPWGIRAYEKALYLDELSDAAIDVVLEHGPKKVSPLSFCPTFILDGAYRNMADDATAFSGRRSARIVMNIAGLVPDPAPFERECAWVRGFWDAMRPFSSDGAGGYINFQSDADDARIRKSYGEKYDRLAAIKAKYDPGNVFHLNANIRPA